VKVSRDNILHHERFNLQISGQPHVNWRHRGTAVRVAIAMHLTAGAIALVLCLFLPRQGSAVLLLPIRGHGQSADAAFLASNGLTLVGAGRIPGSLVVRAGSNASMSEWLRQGFLPIAAPMQLCVPDDNSRAGAGPRNNLQDWW